MKKLKLYFRQFLCRLRGGHIYTGNYLETTRNERDMTYIFRNRCLRCGKEFEIEVPMENLLGPTIEPMHIHLNEEQINEMDYLSRRRSNMCHFNSIS